MLTSTLIKSVGPVSFDCSLSLPQLFIKGISGIISKKSPLATLPSHQQAEWVLARWIFLFSFILNHITLISYLITLLLVTKM